MRARILIGGILVSVGILTAGVESAVSQATSTSQASGDTATGGTTSGSGSSTGGTGSSGSSGSGSSSDGSSSDGSSSDGSSSSGSSSSGSSTTMKDGTYTGTASTTQFGDVQVQITVSGGTITAVKALQLTDREQRSVQISDYAAPILQREALAAQSADIDTVTGATYTSDGYAQSLQSAIDQAES